MDANQSRIVAALRAVGATVQPLHMVGAGVPDLLVGYHGVNYLLEVKDGEQPPSARKLTAEQVEWHAAWRGNVAVVCNIEEAITIIGAM